MNTRGIWKWQGHDDSNALIVNSIIPRAKSGEICYADSIGMNMQIKMFAHLQDVK